MNNWFEFNGEEKMMKMMWREKGGEKSFSFYLREISESWYQVPVVLGTTGVTGHEKIDHVFRPSRREKRVWYLHVLKTQRMKTCWYQVPLVPDTTGTKYQNPTLRDFSHFSISYISFFLSLSLRHWFKHYKTIFFNK